MHMMVKLAISISLLSALTCGAQALTRADLGRKALETVVTHIKSDDSDVRALAAEILGDAGNRSASGILRKLLEDKDKYVRIAAARSLWELGSPVGVKTIYAIINDVPAQGPVAVTNTPLVELKIISQNKIRAKAMETLVRMKGEKASEILFKMKNDNYGTIRDAAARELARIGYDEELTQFTDALASEDEALRYESALVMGKVCSPAAAQPLKTLLASEKSVRVKMAALDALNCNPSKKEALKELLKLADDENSTIKYKAVTALSGIKDPGAQSKLAALAAGTSDIRLRIVAQKGLALGGTPPDAATVRSALDAVSPDIKLAALDLLAAFPEDQAVPLLAAALDDVNVQVKLTAALQVLKRFSRQ